MCSYTCLPANFHAADLKKITDVGFLFVFFSLVCLFDLFATAAKPAKGSVAEMTTNALKTMNDRKGNTMASIKTFIAKEYQREIGKSLVTHIKKFMEQEWLAGRIRMTNFDSNTINFSKRFTVVKKGVQTD